MADGADRGAGLEATGQARKRGHGRTGLARCLVLGIIAVGAQAYAAVGPGIPKLRFLQSEIGTKLYVWHGLGERIVKAQMVNGYLGIFQDRGNRIQFYDISDPRNPKEVSKIISPAPANPPKFNQHTVPCWGDTIISGASAFDISDPAHPKVLGYTSQSTNVFAGFSWPYLYASTTDYAIQATELSINDFSDPLHPKPMGMYNTSSLAGFGGGADHVIGNLLIISSGDGHSGISFWDIGKDPLKPQLLSSIKATTGMYVSQVYGKYLVLSGPPLGKLAFYDFSDPYDVKKVFEDSVAGMGEYAHFQNGYLYGGRIDSPDWIKFRISDFQTVYHGIKAEKPISRYVIPIGNLLWVGSPYKDSAALYVGNADPDSIPPSVLYANPADGAMRIPLTGRVGFAIDEEVDARTVKQGNLVVRPVGGQPIAGVWSSCFGAVNFTPAKPLLANTAYEAVVAKGGLADNSGNAIPAEFKIRFSTGAQVTSIAAAKAKAGKAALRRNGSTVEFIAPGKGPGSEPEKGAVFESDGRQVIRPEP